jgi:hypothetical protein
VVEHDKTVRVPACRIEELNDHLDELRYLPVVLYPDMDTVETVIVDQDRIHVQGCFDVLLVSASGRKHIGEKLQEYTKKEDKGGTPMQVPPHFIQAHSLHDQ